MHKIALAAAAVGLSTAGLVGAVAVADAEEKAPRQAAQIGDRFARTELYFGTDKPGPDVTDEQFRRFIREEVTPRFPDGLTQLEALGQFRDSRGKIVRERSKVIILLYPVASKESSAAIEAIRDAYEKTHKQESVLRSDSLELVSF